ncbi:Lipocalin-like protein [Tenacibaculum sp. 190524A05c]
MNMKNLKKQILNSLAILALVFVVSCSESEDNLPQELSIQEKVTLLENGEWLLKDFEDSVMHTFVNGERLTFYGTEGKFTEPIPGKNAYTIVDSKLMIDYNFGNTKTYELRVSCNNNIIEMYSDNEIQNTLYRKDSNYKDCLN